MSTGRVLIAGGSGFIDGALAREFSARGDQVVVLTRSPRPRADGVLETAWDATSAGAWSSQLEDAKAVINLAGRNINCLHTPENLSEIRSSRVNAVNALAQAMALAKSPPPVWVQASAAGFYGDSGALICEESAPAGNDTLAGVCRQWEAAFASVPGGATRKVTLRIGFVLGREGGALPVLGKLTRWFLGGSAGTGRQYISWIHLADLAAMFRLAVEDDRLSGVYNAVAPTPVTNAEFMRTLRGALRRPWSPPAPALAVQLGARLMGSDGSLALAGQRCAPKRFLEAGFRFQFGAVAPALEDLVR